MNFTTGLNKTAALLGTNLEKHSSSSGADKILARLKSVDAKTVDHFVSKLKAQLGDFKYKEFHQKAQDAHAQQKSKLQRR